MTDEATPTPAIAITGMACRFPGAPDLDTFWQVLVEGRDTITRDLTTEPKPDAGGLQPLRAYGVLNDIDRFDRHVFGLSKREAALVDPQQRIWLQTAWQALEDAGQGRPNNLVTAVYAGCNTSSYLERNLKQDAQLAERLRAHSSSESRQILNGNDKDFLPLRTSYALGLTGPSVNVQSACSTALVAVATACRALVSLEADISVAGGVSIVRTTDENLYVEADAIHSSDGYCRPFDAAANGTVFGDGAGAVVLRRLEDALADGDRVYAVIKGWGISNDGAAKASFAAPNARAQADAVRRAQCMAGFAAHSVSYIEAHGTGTKVGDPIEFDGLRRALASDSHQPCGIGSVKSNVGHLDVASGIAGLIKTSLMLHHAKLVPSLGFETANPLLDIERTRFYVVTNGSRWKGVDFPRRAGVTALGVGGTNCHLALEEAPNIDERPVAAGPYLLTFSAWSRPALARYTEAHLAALENVTTELADYCRCVATGRRDFEFRRAFVAESLYELRHALEKRVAETEVEPSANPRLAFMFSGQLSSYANMAHDLFSTQPTFRRWLLRCEELLTPWLDRRLTDVLFSEENLLDLTSYEQPALCALQVALVETWRYWGVVPHVVLGYSLGEYAAAYAAGAASLEDILRLVATRGRLMEAIRAEGMMLAVTASPQQLHPLLDSDQRFYIAAYPTSESCVLSGETAGLVDAIPWLDGQGYAYRTLTERYAFHSPWVGACLGDFGEAVQGITWRSPDCKFVSTVTGALEAERLTEPGYWIEQARQPVRFKEAIESAKAIGVDLFLEVGPSTMLTDIVRMSGVVAQNRALHSLRPEHLDSGEITQAISALYEAGVAVDWCAYYAHQKGPRISVPGYPFERESFWVGGSPPSNAVVSPAANALPGCKPPPTLTVPVTIERIVNQSIPAYLEDHRLFGQIVVPASAHLSWLISAIRSHWRADTFALEELVFLCPVVIRSGREVQIRAVFSAPPLNAGDEDCFVFEVNYQDATSESAAVCFLTGQLKIKPEGDFEDFAVDRTALDATFPKDIEGTVFYQDIWVQRENTGEALRRIEHLWYRDNEAVASLRQNKGSNNDSEDLPCPVIESCFQTLYASTDIESEVDLVEYRRTWVPYTIDEVRYRHTISTENWWCRACHRHDERTDSSVTGDLSLYTVDGWSVLQVRGFHLRPLAATAVLSQISILDHIYECQLEPAATVAPHQISGDRRAVLIIAASNPASRDLADCLLEQLSRVQVVRGDEHDLDSAALTASLNVLQSTPKGITVLFLDHADTRGQASESVMACRPLLNLIALLDDRVDLDVELLVSTRCVDTHASTVYAAMEGLVRVVINERPRLNARLISQHSNISPESQINNLISELCSSEPGEQIVYLPNGRHCRSLRATKPRSDIISFRDDASYVIVGEEGEQTIACAKWLLDRGAGQVTLAFANADAPAIRNSVDRRILICEVDVAVAASCDALLGSSTNDDFPLAGIFVVPWLMDDGVLERQNWARFSAAVTPLVNGLVNISRSSEAYALEHFVCFSSSAAVLGSQGQASYAAACSFMDAMCAERRARGLPGLSINWGPWANMGHWNREEARKQATLAQGWQPIEPAQALTLTGQLMASQASRVCVLPVEWQTLAAKNGPQGIGIVRQLLGGPMQQQALPRSSKGTTAVSASAVLSELVGEDVAQYPPDTLLQELGLDSLMAVALRNALRREQGIDLMLKDLLGSTTLADLTALDTVQAGVSRFSASHTHVAGRPTVVPLGEQANTGQPLFCLEWFGAYRQLANALDGSHSVHVVWMEDDQDYAALHEHTVEHIATRYLQEVQAIQPHGPYHLLGSSFAGLVAFEMAQQLCRVGESVGLLALIDSNTPAVINSWQARWLPRFDQLRLGGVSSVTQALRKRVSSARPSESTLRTAFRRVAIENYQPQPYAGRVILCVAEDDSFDFRPPDLGWSPYVKGGLTIHPLYGDHHGLTTPAGA
ncbi:MAG: beta-ketoacyl synthase N-terminal-like domain-containing protein, partial [Pseudomonadales bacterium]